VGCAGELLHPAREAAEVFELAAEHGAEGPGMVGLARARGELFGLVMAEQIQPLTTRPPGVAAETRKSILASPLEV
jgi:hypothetical protein